MERANGYLQIEDEIQNLERKVVGNPLDRSVLVKLFNEFNQIGAEQSKSGLATQIIVRCLLCYSSTPGCRRSELNGTVIALLGFGPK